MKNFIKLICLSLVVTLFITSCSKDDDSSMDDDSSGENSSNTIEYSGEIIDITEALIEDYGTTFDDTYYNYGYTLNGDLDDVEYEFYAELYSKGTSEFRTGTFEYISDSEEPSDSDEFYFQYASLYNGDTELDVVGGNITVTGSDSEYAISGTLTLDNDETVTINYDGSFSVYTY